MGFVRAGPAEILRSSQKDDSIIKTLEKLFENILLGFGGPRLSVKYKNQLPYLAYLLYFGNTTLASLQTLGEEYTGILQVDSSLRNIPSFVRRSTMIILDCFGSSMASSLMTSLELFIEKNDNFIPEGKLKLLNAVRILKSLIPYVSHLHKAYFYYQWKTYHLSKRITGIDYVLIRYWLKERQSLYGFKILGIIAFLNLMIVSLQSSLDFITSGNIPREEHSLIEIRADTKQLGKTCPMCLNNFAFPSCTPCGHIYCWRCILEWLNNENKCPICRELIVSSRIVPLMNYC